MDALLTPNFRAGYLAVFKPRASKNPDGTMGAPKYSVRALFPPGTDLKAMKEAAKAAAVEKFGEKLPKVMRPPFRLNSDLENPVQGIGDDWIVMTFSTNADNAPGLVDQRNQDIIDEKTIFSGCWFRAQVRPAGYDNAGNKGVSFFLQNLQLVKKDEPLGGGRMPANKAFTPVEDASEDGDDPNDMFK